MEIRVILKIAADGYEGDDGLWQINQLDTEGPGDSGWSFESYSIPPIGTILHIGNSPLDGLLKGGFTKDAARKILGHYTNWIVIEHFDWWDVYSPDRIITGVICQGENAFHSADLKYKDLLNPELHPEKNSD